jgi:DUF4097 and DUF4098 domain-containing protein YvlB
MQRRFGWLAGILAGVLVWAVFVPVAAAADVKGNFERTLKVSGPAQLNVETGSGDISVRTGDASTVRVKAIVHVHVRSENGRTSAEDTLRSIQENPPIEQQGNSIRIGHDAGTRLMHGVSIDYALEVPSGSDFAAHSGSGDMSLAGPLAKVEVETGSGDVSVERVSGNLRLSTGSGDVRLKQAGAAGAAVRTGSGDVDLELPSEGSFNLAVSTGSGDISSATGMQFEQISSRRGQLRAKVRGGGQDFNVQTGSGDVSIH